MFFGKKKERELNVFSEDEVHKKLYGYIKGNEEPRAKDKEKTDLDSKIDFAEKEQVKQDAQERVKTLEDELVFTRQAIENSKVKIGNLKDKAFKRTFQFVQAKNLRIFIALAIILMIGLVLLKSGRKETVSLDKKETTPPAKVVKTTPTSSFYTIQACVYDKEKDAEKLVDRFRRDNLDAYICIANSGKKIKYRVYIGKFASKKDALRTLKIAQRDFKDSFVRLVE